MLWLLLQQIRNELEIFLHRMYHQFAAKLWTESYAQWFKGTSTNGLASTGSVKANTNTNTNTNFFIFFSLVFLYFQLANL
jgi:hypothetical protein